MKVEIKQSTLSKIINIVQKGTSTTSSLSILECLLMEAYDNRLKVTSTNLEIRIEMSVDCNVLKPGSIVVTSKLFGNIIRSLPDEDIIIDVINNNISIKCDNANFNVVGQQAVEYPKIPEIDNNINISIPKQLLKSMIKQTIIATAQTEMTPILKGVQLKVSDNTIFMVALDRYRLAVKNIQMNNSQDISAIIPAKTLIELSRIIDEDEEDVIINFTRNHILFELGNIVIVSILLEGNFANYEQFITNEYTTKVTVNTKNFQKGVERAALLDNNQGFNLVKLEINDEIMMIKADSSIGNVEENIPITIEGNNLSIAFNTKYLLEGLKVIDTEEIEIYFTNEVSPCIIRPKYDNSYIYLIVPIRMKKELK